MGTTTACVSADKGNGLYRLCPGGDPARCHDAYCDTTTSGGPWTLLWSYSRDGRVPPPPLKYALPNSPTESYSHVNADFLDVQRAEVEAARFYCVTSNHDRVLHFMSNNSKVLKSVWQGGAPSSRDDWLEFEALEGHTALLPAITERAGFAGTASLSWYPFWRWNHVCWSIKGIDNRFECDDKYSKTHNTTHQIWARLSPRTWQPTQSPRPTPQPTFTPTASAAPMTASVAPTMPTRSGSNGGGDDNFAAAGGGAAAGAALLVLAAGALYYWRRAKRGAEKAQSDTAQMMVEQPEASVPREPAASARNEPDAAAGGGGDEEATTTVGPASSTAAMRIEDVRLELGRALGAARHDMSRAVERAEASKPRPGRRHRSASPTTSTPPAPAPPPPPVDKFENATYHWQNAAGAQCGPSSWAEYTTAHAEGDTHSGCLVFAAGVTDAWVVVREVPGLVRHIKRPSRPRRPPPPMPRRGPPARTGPTGD